MGSEMVIRDCLWWLWRGNGGYEVAIVVTVAMVAMVATVWWLWWLCRGYGCLLFTADAADEEDSFYIQRRLFFINIQPSSSITAF